MSSVRNLISPGLSLLFLSFGSITLGQQPPPAWAGQALAQLDSLSHQFFLLAFPDDGGDYSPELGEELQSLFLPEAQVVDPTVKVLYLIGDLGLEDASKPLSAPKYIGSFLANLLHTSVSHRLFHIGTDFRYLHRGVVRVLYSREISISAGPFQLAEPDTLIVSWRLSREGGPIGIEWMMSLRAGTEDADLDRIPNQWDACPFGHCPRLLTAPVELPTAAVTAIKADLLLWLAAQCRGLSSLPEGISSARLATPPLRQTAQP